MITDLRALLELAVAEGESDRQEALDRKTIQEARERLATARRREDAADALMEWAHQVIRDFPELARKDAAAGRPYSVLVRNNEWGWDDDVKVVALRRLLDVTGLAYENLRKPYRDRDMCDTLQDYTDGEFRVYHPGKAPDDSRDER